jgi:hypothetical protein
LRPEVADAERAGEGGGVEEDAGGAACKDVHRAAA